MAQPLTIAKQPALQTSRLTLRPFEAGDIPRLLEVCNQPEISSAMVTMPSPYTVEYASSWINRIAKEFEQTETVYYALLLKGSETLIGGISLFEIDMIHNQAELSFWLDNAYSGQGYVTEAAELMLAYGFETLNLNRIYAYHLASNIGSKRILQKLGMTQEGHLRERVFKANQYLDALLWSILKSEWVS